MKKIILFFLILILLLFYIKKPIIESFNFEYDKNQKLKLYDECKFEGYGFNKLHEIGECSISIQVIPYVKNVLEIGGGSGKVSHIINKMLKKRNLEKKHVVVEPGTSGKGHNFQDLIYKNKTKFNDKYTIVKKMVENLTMNDLKILDKKPECLYVDCEGCLHNFFDTSIGKYCLEQSRFVINEQDSSSINKDINDLYKILKSYNFKLIDYGYGCGTRCLTDIWYKEN